MGRSRKFDLDAQLTSLVTAVADHPWARPELIMAISGLPEHDFNRLDTIAVELGLIDVATVPSARRSPRRYGLTRDGANFLGINFQSVKTSALALLRATHLDCARQLLTEWGCSFRMVWAMSPFTISGRNVVPHHRHGR